MKKLPALLLLLMPLLASGQVVLDTVLKLRSRPMDLLYVPGVNKLYVNTASNVILVLDCATYEVTGEIPTRSDYPCHAYGAWNWRRQKLYYVFNIRPDSIAVIDPWTDSVLRWIPSRAYRPPCYVSSNDRVYVAAHSLYAIDCEPDTLIEIAPPDSGSIWHDSPVQWDSVGNKVYDSWGWSDLLRAYSCETDSLVSWLYCGVQGMEHMVFNPVRRKAYIQGGWRWDASIIDTRVDSVIRSLPRGGYGRYPGVWNATEDKVYLPDHDTLYIIDCATDSVVGRIGGFTDFIRCIDWTPWSNRLYVAARDYVRVLDCRTDSVIVPGITVGDEPREMLLDEVNRRVYVICRTEADSQLYVLRDATPGLEEQPPVSVTPSPLPTILRNVLNLQSPISNPQSPMVLMDACGRRVMALLPGPNDVSHLSPGVYFVATTEGVTGRVVKVR